MLCQYCGQHLPDGAKFCDNCGRQTAAEQARILSLQEKHQKENPPAFLDFKTAVVIAVVFFVILPGACLAADAPLWLGFVTAGVLSVLCLVFGIRNQFSKK